MMLVIVKKLRLIVVYVLLHYCPAKNFSETITPSGSVA